MEQSAKCKCKLQKLRKSCFSLTRNCGSRSKRRKLCHSGFRIAQNRGWKGGDGAASSKAEHLVEAFPKFASMFNHNCCPQQQCCAFCVLSWQKIHFPWIFPCFGGSFYSHFYFPSPWRFRPEVQHLRIGRQSHLLHFARLWDRQAQNTENIWKLITQTTKPPHLICDSIDNTKKYWKYWKKLKNIESTQNRNIWVKVTAPDLSDGCTTEMTTVAKRATASGPLAIASEKLKIENITSSWPNLILFVFFFPFGCKTSQKIGLQYSEIVPSTQYDQNQKYAFSLVGPSLFLVPPYSHSTRYANHKCHRSESFNISVRACQTNLWANILQKMAAILRPLAFMCWINSLIKSRWNHSPLKYKRAFRGDEQWMFCFIDNFLHQHLLAESLDVYHKISLSLSLVYCTTEFYQEFLQRWRICLINGQAQQQ